MNMVNVIEFGNTQYAIFDPNGDENIPNADLHPGRELEHSIKNSFSKLTPLTASERNRPNIFSVCRDVQLFGIDGYFYEWYADGYEGIIWMDDKGMENFYARLESCLFCSIWDLNMPVNNINVCACIPNLNLM